MKNEHPYYTKTLLKKIRNRWTSPKEKWAKDIYKQFTKEEIPMVNDIWAKIQPSYAFSEIKINIKDLVRMWGAVGTLYVAGRGSN